MACGEGTAIIGLATPPIVLAFTLTPWSRLDFEIVTAPWPLAGFDGWFSSWSATLAPEPRDRTAG